jgi:serine/threonine protein kinase
MPAPTTTVELVDLVRRSGLIDPGRLENVLGQTTNGDAQVTPRQVANQLVAAGLVTQFQAEQFLLGKWRGFTIGKYKVLERLGFGGNGTVYLCEHLVVKRRVAVKVLPLAKAANPGALGRFYREARASGVLNHPNLVKAHDVDQENGLHFLVMEYVDGASLQELVVKTGPLLVARAANYIKQAALGLQAAHGAGLVHRDIKPSNILLDRAGTVKVLDLGLARFFNDETDILTIKYNDHAVLGTADYVAPEQAINSHGADIRADIYSLGCTFYFLLAGRPPFPGGKVAYKLMMHQTQMPTPIRELRPDVPAELAVVVETMLAKDPARRYQTPAEVVEVLAPWTATPIPPPSDAEMPRLSPAARGEAGDPDPGPLSPGLAPRLPARGPTTPNRHIRQPLPAGVAFARKPATQAELATPALNVETPTAHETRQAPSPPPSLPPAQQRPLSEPALISTAKPARPVANRSLRRLGAILIASAVIGVMARWAVSQWTKAPADSLSGTTHVVSSSGDPGTHPSIAAALRHARPGDRIEVRAETWEEDVHIQGDNGVGRDVRIEGHSPDERPVVWRAPKGRDDGRPLLKITSATGLQVSGFTLDGQDRVRTLIVLAGECPGVTLENLQLTGFQQSGIALRNCAGEDLRPVTLQRLRVVPTRAAGSALHFDSRGEEVNRAIRVVNCRLEGPYEAAVVLSGRTADVELTHNRVFNATDGVVYRKVVPAYPAGVRLASNTFYRITELALHFEVAPPADGSRLELTRNLFGHVGRLAHVEGFAGEAGQLFAELSGNYRDDASTEGVPTLNTPVLRFALPTDPADDATFLRYPPGSEPAAAGSPGVPPAGKQD